MTSFGTLGLVELMTESTAFQSKLTGANDVWGKHMNDGIFIGPSEAMDRSLVPM